MEKTPEEVLADSAKAAAELLPGLEQQRDTIRQQLNSLEQRIGVLRAIASINVSIPEFVNPALPHIQRGIISGAMLDDQTSRRPMSGGLIGSLIRSDNSIGLLDMVKHVLRPHPLGLTVKAIAEAISNQFNYDAPQSSLYAVLKRSQERGRLIEEDGRWRGAL